MISKDDRFTKLRIYHVRLIAKQEEHVHLQKTPPHDRSSCRGHASAFRNLLETHPDIAERISKLAKRKSPVYGRGGRAPICEIHREMCMALRAKGQKNSSDRPKPTIAGTGNLSTTRKVLGSIERGRRPAIFFMGVRYTSARLACTPFLVGRKVILSVNKNNLQTISVLFENGQFFDVLEPLNAIWRVPHSYEFRKQFLKRCRQAYVPKEIL